MQDETLVTSSGVIRNRSVPRVGIVSAQSLYNELFEDCLNDGIDLSYESLYQETFKQIEAENPNYDYSWIEDRVNESMEMIEFDTRVFLLGAWVKDDEGNYIVDKSGKSGSYALEYNTGSGNVSVEWSTLTVKCGHTSPCYVMSDNSGPCGDLDSKGDGVIAYTLPRDMFRNNDNE